MARDESNREDLLREATALVERIELVLRKSDHSIESNDLIGQHIVAGFRRDGALSVFFGEDPVYQFNAAGELRRAYCGGNLLKATRGRLASLERVRTQNEIQLVSHELSREEEATFMSKMHDRLCHFSELIDLNLLEVVGRVPPDADVLGRLKKCLATNEKRQIAARPNA
jgi:hypothetical protein